METCVEAQVMLAEMLESRGMESLRVMHCALCCMSRERVRILEEKYSQRMYSYINLKRARVDGY